MGRRELGLIVGFVVLGVIVWQVTAPKAEGPGFSFGRWLGEVRREMGGRRASAEVTTALVIPMNAKIEELRLTLTGEVTITGEDREDVAAELHAVSNGFDNTEAQKLAGEVALKVSTFADSVVLGWTLPRPGTQRTRLTLRVPARLRIQLDGRGTGEVVGVTSVTLSRAAGTLKLRDIDGLVKGEYRGSLTIDGAEAVDLISAGGESVIGPIREDVRLEVRTGQVRLQNTAGRVTITGRDGRIRVDGAAGELRAETFDGELELNDLQGPIEIDARNTEISVGWQRAAAAKIQAREGSLDLRLPKESDDYTLDARASGGLLVVPEFLQKTTAGQETSVTKSGGPDARSIFVRGVDTRITIR